MAVVWQKDINGTHYEVRKAGNSTRLYTDGVFHSQYNPEHRLTKGVWDLLMLPAFFQPPGSIKRVLVLGVGGGSVLQLIHQFVKPEVLIGIELIPVHLTIAKRFFGVDKKIARLYLADAVNWLQNYTGPPFDMIIDDLFGEENGEGVRAVSLNSTWFNLLNKNLSKIGILVVNLLCTKTLLDSAYFTNPRIAGNYDSVYKLTFPQFHNVIAAFLKQQSSNTLLRRNLLQCPELDFKKQYSKTPFRVQRVN